MSSDGTSATAGDSGAIASSGRCVAADCACSGFEPQLYRPGSCVSCYHTVALHYPGTWNEVRDASGRVFFQNASGDRLLARVNDSEQVASLSQALRRVASSRRDRSSTLTDASSVAPQADAWASFLAGTGALTSASGQQLPQQPLQRTAPGPPSTSSAAPVAPSRPSLPPTAPKPAALVPTVAPIPEGEDDDEEGDAAARVAAAMTPAAVAQALEAAAANVPDAPSAVPQAALNALAIDLSKLGRRLGGAAAPAQLSFEPTPVDAHGGATPVRAEISALGQSVTQVAAGAASVSRGQAGQQAESLALPPPPAEAFPVAGAESIPAPPSLPPPPPAATAVAVEEGAGAAGAAAHSSAHSSGSANTAVEAAAEGSPAEGAEARPAALLGDGSALDYAGLDADHAHLLAMGYGYGAGVGGAGAAAAPSAPSAPLESPAAGGDSSTSPASTIDLGMHLGPVYDDPLTVRLDTPAFSKDKGGVLIFRIAQPYEEDFTVPRYLLVTPFTLIAVAPHPTKLNVGIVKWERSILSLTTMVSQPLFTAISASAKVSAPTGTNGASTVDDAFAPDRVASRKSRADSLSMDDFVLDRLPYGMEASTTGGAGVGAAAGGSGVEEQAGAAVKLGRRSLSSQIGASVRSLFFKPSAAAAGKGRDSTSEGAAGGSGASGPTRPRTASSASKAGGSPLLGPQPTKGQEVRYKLSGIGLLTSFSPESGDTMTLLRTYRAGKRPQKLQGWLWKRKRQAWREHAPLGPLAWKKRYFVLEPGHITYYARQGGDIKGMVPLTGWVEVARVGPDAGPASTLGDATTKPHCFVVRTGRTYHVFQAGSSAEADAWVDSITINAQHTGCALDEPQCLILPSHADAEALAKAVEKRRADLKASLGEGSVYQGMGEMLVDLTASETIAQAALAQQTATAMAIADAYEAREEARRVAQEALMLAHAQQAAEAEERAAAEAAIAAAAAAASHEAAVPEPAEGSISVAEAEALVLAMGEASDEFLQQLPRSVQLEIRRRHRPDTVAAAEAEFARRDAALAARRQAAAAAAAGPAPNAGYRHQQEHASAGASAADASSAPSATSGPTPVPPAFGPSLWVYIDDGGQPQGPFPEEAMRAWLLARYFAPTTLVHAASPLTPAEAAQGLQDSPAEDADGSEGALRPVVDTAGVPTVYLPLSSLFPDPNSAFAGYREWVARYKRATAYQSLYNAAMHLGIERHTALAAVLLMKDNGMSPSLGLLLDMMADAEFSGLIAADAEDRARAEHGHGHSSSSASAGHGHGHESSGSSSSASAFAAADGAAAGGPASPLSPTSALSLGARSDRGFPPSAPPAADGHYSGVAPGMHGAGSGSGAGGGQPHTSTSAGSATGVVVAATATAGMFSLLG